MKNFLQKSLSRPLFYFLAILENMKKTKEWVNDPKVNCFSACMLKKIGIVSSFLYLENNCLHSMKNEFIFYFIRNVSRISYNWKDFHFIILKFHNLIIKLKKKTVRKIIKISTFEILKILLGFFEDYNRK